MVDSDLTVKVGDFGLAFLMDRKLVPSQTTGPAGTIGYMAPEYINTGRASKESDLFRFGVVAVGIATGRRSGDMNGGDICLSAGLVKWAWDMFGSQKLNEPVDEKLNRE